MDDQASINLKKLAEQIREVIRLLKNEISRSEFIQTSKLPDSNLSELVTKAEKLLDLVDTNVDTNIDMLIEQFTELLQQDQADLHQYLHGFLIKNKNTDYVYLMPDASELTANQQNLDELNTQITVLNNEINDLEKIIFYSKNFIQQLSKDISKIDKEIDAQQKKLENIGKAISANTDKLHQDLKTTKEKLSHPLKPDYWKTRGKKVKKYIKNARNLQEEFNATMNNLAELQKLKSQKINWQDQAHDTIKITQNNIKIIRNDLDNTKFSLTARQGIDIQIKNLNQKIDQYQNQIKSINQRIKTGGLLYKFVQFFLAFFALDDKSSKKKFNATLSELHDSLETLQPMQKITLPITTPPISEQDMEANQGYNNNTNPIDIKSELKKIIPPREKNKPTNHNTPKK
jgi:chromosome segregation ATPase